MHVFQKLMSGVYQVCVRPILASPSLSVYDGLQSSYASNRHLACVRTHLFQQDIVGLWVDDVNMHDGLHAVLFGSRDERSFLRGRLRASRSVFITHTTKPLIALPKAHDSLGFSFRLCL